jgi:hypothetical protein
MFGDDIAGQANIRTGAPSQSMLPLLPLQPAFVSLFWLDLRSSGVLFPSAAYVPRRNAEPRNYHSRCIKQSFRTLA